jgi:hypothetical protein
MATHEKHCTMNPNRACRVCGILGGPVKPDPDGLRALVALLPDGGEPPGFGDELNDYVARAQAAIPKLREAANDCPACMLAALRQAKVHLGMVSGEFDFSAEMREIFANQEPRQGYDY